VLKTLEILSESKGIVAIGGSIEFAGSECLQALNKMKTALEIVYLPIDQIKPYEWEFRKHSKDQIAKAEKLIGHFGQATPFIVDKACL